jgi:hypothetical protein
MANISELNKADLVILMRSNGDIHRYDQDKPTWKRAFKLIILDGYENLEMDCPKCIDKVKTWLDK